MIQCQVEVGNRCLKLDYEVPERGAEYFEYRVAYQVLYFQTSGSHEKSQNKAEAHR